MLVHGCGRVLPQSGWQTGVRGIALLLWSSADIREAALGHGFTAVKHQVEAVVGCLDEDEEDGDRGAVDTEGHGGGGQGLRKENNTHTHN